MDEREIKERIREARAHALDCIDRRTEDPSRCWEEEAEDWLAEYRYWQGKLRELKTLKKVVDKDKAGMIK